MGKKKKKAQNRTSWNLPKEKWKNTYFFMYVIMYTKFLYVNINVKQKFRAFFKGV